MCRIPVVRVGLLCTVLCVLCMLCIGGARAGLYSDSDQVTILTTHNRKEFRNCPSAALIQYYTSWCGQSITFSRVWKKLVLDIKGWKSVIRLMVVDCDDDIGALLCAQISNVPFLGFLNAFSQYLTRAVHIGEPSYDVRSLRHLIVDKLEFHKHPRPSAYPPLKKTSAREVDSYVENSRGKNLVLVFEKHDSYVGREVILDLLQYKNITVRRVLHSEEELVYRLGVTDFPSVYLYNTHTNFTRLSVVGEAREFYSYALRSLPGVVQKGKPHPEQSDLIRNDTEEPWRPFNKTRVYMSDLESALHYSLRVELASHTVISDEALIALKGYILVLDKYFPGRPPVKNALKAVNSWLQTQEGTSLNYSDFRAALNSTAVNGWLQAQEGTSLNYSDFRATLNSTSTDSYLPEVVRWVACQGSKQHYRGYPCALWTLFHILTVQALETESKDPQEVLRAMKLYFSHFFDCRECAHHFDHEGIEGMHHVTSVPAAVLWLWSHHNRVNAHLTGELSEDPHFPKVQWPPPDLCPACHGLKPNREHTWVQDEVLAFLRNYYSAENILHNFLSDDITVGPTD